MCAICCPRNLPKFSSSGCSYLFSPSFDVFCFMYIRGLMQCLTRDVRLSQQFVELVIANGKHFYGSAFRGADRSAMLLLVEEFHFAEIFSGSKLNRHHIRLIRTRQD